MPFFGAGKRNRDAVRAENAAYRRDKDIWEQNEKERKEAYDFSKDQYESQVQHQEDNIRFQEKNLIQQYDQAVERQDYEYQTAERAYDKSLDQAATQKKFNVMAEAAAVMEQNAKKRDDLLGVMFDESDTLLEYGFATTGLKVDKQNKLVAANFEESKINTKYIGDVGAFELDRRKSRSESQVETQKAIIEGMKAAGQIRARGGTGRSAAKGVLAVMAESGALRATIANGLMYAEQSVDLNIAQLKDMLILDQTMVLAARDAANTEYDLKSSKADASLGLDKMKIAASRTSIKERDAIVRKNILLSRQQADLNAEAQIMMQPERLPEVTNPADFYAEYDDPETEDYVEMLLRPMVADFPKYVKSPKPQRERDYVGSLGRENVAMSNFGDVLKIGGIVAGGIGAIGATGALAGVGISGMGTAGASMATMYSSIGTGLSTLGNQFSNSPTRY